MKTLFVFLLCFPFVLQAYSQNVSVRHNEAEMKTALAGTQNRQVDDENFCSLDARLIEGDSVCIVEASTPLELFYDDGTHEEMISWVSPGGETAVRYDPPGYPFVVTGGKINVGDGTFPSGADFLGTDFRIIVYDDDGTDSLPGTALDSVTVTVDRYEWIKFGGLNAEITGGSFYIAMKQLNGPLFSAPVGVDNEEPSYNRSYVKQPETGDWIKSPYQDIMLRALMCGSTQAKSSGGESLWYQLGRVTGFDPNNGETPQDGVLTVIDSLSVPWYEDSLFYTLPEGYYAYALRVVSGETDTSGWYYTNTLLQPLAVQEHDFSHCVDVYPNPVQNMLFIRSEENILSVAIVAANGERVFSRKVNNKTAAVNVNALENGIYFVKITTNRNSSSYKKIVVKR